MCCSGEAISNWKHREQTPVMDLFPVTLIARSLCVPAEKVMGVPSTRGDSWQKHACIHSARAYDRNLKPLCGQLTNLKERVQERGESEKVMKKTQRQEMSKRRGPLPFNVC